MPCPKIQIVLKITRCHAIGTTDKPYTPQMKLFYCMNITNATTICNYAIQETEERTNVVLR